MPAGRGFCVGMALSGEALEVELGSGWSDSAYCGCSREGLMCGGS